MNCLALISALLLASAVAQVALSGNGQSLPMCCKNNKKGTFENPASSCNEIVQKIPNFQPGYIWIADSTGQPQLVYCTASTQCCDEDGGWMRIAYLDMTNLDHKCPSGFDVITDPTRACIRKITTSGCPSVEYSTLGIEYTKVCGRVRGYGQTSTDAFRSYHLNNGLTLNDQYVDGVSITQGNPREHIWTFAAGISETIDNSISTCPCIASSLTFAGTVPPFIGTDYFCESGGGTVTDGVTVDDPLWDGQGCPSDNTCCSLRNPPLFCQQVAASSDDIELRVCTDEGVGNENVLLELVEIFVQ